MKEEQVTIVVGGRTIDLPLQPAGKWHLVPWWHYQRWKLDRFVFIPLLRSDHIFRRKIFRWTVDHKGCCGEYVWEYGGKEV